jgi:secernin
MKMCDTFVALPEGSLDGYTIFGKNSDRPHEEVQLITFSPHKEPKEKELKCTYITIPQTNETYAVLLSQPWWMWGAEMGVNEHGVAIGNEAVHTKEPLVRNGLLGMDLLRLGLERARNATEALGVITTLLEEHGQGGSNAYAGKWYYHNSFLIADPEKAWVLETADKWWVAERVEDVRSISNNLSIRGKGDKRKDGIIEYALKKGYCKNKQDFDFALHFSDSSVQGELPLTNRAVKSTKLLAENNGRITLEMMMEFLRDHDAGICMHGSFESTGSQVSHLKPLSKSSIHWFTGTTKPCLSIYKPYIFPVDDFEVLDAKPYKEIKDGWQWLKQKEYTSKFKKLKNQKEKQKFINEMRAIETNIINQVKALEHSESEMAKNEFVKQLEQVNQGAWKKSYDLIV